MTNATYRELGEGDDGRVISVRPGESFDLLLPENATTGYRWSADSVSESVLRLIADTPVTPRTGGIGAGGARRFRFEAARAGEAELRLKLWRPWEGDASVVRRFEARIEVRSGPGG